MKLRLALASVLLAGNAGAQTDVLNMTDAERRAFGSEVRALLLDEPDIVGKAINPPSPAAQEIQQEIKDDLTLLARLAPQILAGNDVALFIGADCSSCARAVSELSALSKDYGATFILHDTRNDDTAKLAKALGMTDVPFYVLPDMILRGHIPQIVLPRYLK